jgi:hypothetical protein
MTRVMSRPPWWRASLPVLPVGASSGPGAMPGSVRPGSWEAPSATVRGAGVAVVAARPRCCSQNVSWPAGVDSAEVVGEALLARARGALQSAVASLVGRARETVRNWVAACSAEPMLSGTTSPPGSLRSTPGSTRWRGAPSASPTRWRRSAWRPKRRASRSGRSRLGPGRRR